MNLLTLPLRTTLGAKYVMALTGLGLIGFVLVHMAGNLLVFAGPDALNSYAEGLKARPPSPLWSARAGLLFIFLLHLFLAVRLWRLNADARPIRYFHEDTVEATWASRHMMLTGLVLLAFIVYHLAHFTFGAFAQPAGTEGVSRYRIGPGPGDILKVKNDSIAKAFVDNAGDAPLPDVYNMVVTGFRNPWITLSYLIAMVFLALHLWHGGSSWFQSLGLNHPQYNPVIRKVGPVLAVLVLVGNCSIPLAVLLGLIK